MRALKKVKKVLCVKGPDAPGFLHGLTTTHIKRLHSVNADVKACQSFLLNHRGQIEFDFTIYEIEGVFYLTVEAVNVEALKSRLEHFLISENVEISELNSSQHKFWWVIDNVEIENDKIIKSPSAFSEDKIFKGFKFEWGFEVNFLQFGVPIKELWITHDENFKEAFVEMSVEEFFDWRILSGLPEREKDYTAKQIVTDLPYQCSISFDKGCYLGQEVVAKAKNLGRSPNKFYIFKAESPIKPNEKITNFSGDFIGEIQSASNNIALGYLRSFVEIQNEKLYSNNQQIFVKK